MQQMDFLNDPATIHQVNPTRHKHYETARRAYMWMSFHPEKRADGECAYFDEIMHEFAGNEQVRKGDTAALVALLGEVAAASILKPDCFGGLGFAGFQLTNTNTKIKATRERIEQLEKRKATVAKDFMVGGVRCVENTEAMRLQLFFDGKPPQAMIALLKNHAFKWAPSVQAWQRQLTNNAVYSFNQWVLPALKAQEA